MPRMTSEYVRNAGLTHKLLLALDKQGYTPSDLNDLAENPKLLKQFLAVKREDAEIKTIERIIDCDTPPLEFWESPRDSEPDLTIVRHDNLGIVPWASLKLEIFYPYQSGVSRADMRLDEKHLLPKYLIGKKVANGNICEYLRRYPHLMSKVKNHRGFDCLMCWGTVYKGKNNDLFAPGIFDESMAFYGVRVADDLVYDQPVILITN